MSLKEYKMFCNREPQNKKWMEFWRQTHKNEGDWADSFKYITASDPDSDKNKLIQMSRYCFYVLSDFGLQSEKQPHAKDQSRLNMRTKTQCFTAEFMQVPDCSFWAVLGCVKSSATCQRNMGGWVVTFSHRGLSGILINISIKPSIE